MNSEEKINWAILVTGWGRSAKDLIKAYSKNKLERSNIKLLVYEETPCGAKDLAEQYNIETLRLIKKDYSDSKSYQTALTNELKKRKIDYIFLLAFKHIIKEEMLDAFPNRILNIHPSLFPSFLGTQTAIQDAIDYGVKVSGITTHIIDEKVDYGTIICQKAIDFPEGSTLESLYPKFSKKGKKIVLETINEIEQLHFVQK
ncbi:formyltransferase family protein [Seonamhaeicola marinus]|uniref:phosphoribosylglycinamide formyltransferase 1 n=1 Tax=Seonamhaeicola marinus TaxID=1912246 RepID=A0A5D0HLK3_9FLAO|nr:formyltransferase family protein [Seonamhaeicola marinus]TYA71860.1 phosphoribosylglycinamide formyltransferase [Seonamhaeicola marinus]